MSEQAFDPDVWHQNDYVKAITRGNPWLDTLEVLTPEYVIALESQLAAARADAARVPVLEAALEHAIWMNWWQFDEHRTGAYGDLKDEASCRCDWCKTYRDTRYEDAAALAHHVSLAGETTDGK